MIKKRGRQSVVRCTAMKGKTRCCLTQGHSGWHHDGSWLEWLAGDGRKAEYATNPCPSTVTYAGRTVPCNLPASHNSAHHGHDLIWTDPITIPEKAWP